MNVYVFQSQYLVNIVNVERHEIKTDKNVGELNKYMLDIIPR
jgi:hypothetical protein